MENRKPKTENGKLVNPAGFTFPVFGFLFSIRSLVGSGRVWRLFMDASSEGRELGG